MNENRKKFPCIWQSILLIAACLFAMFILGIAVELLNVAAKHAGIAALSAVVPYLRISINLILVPVALGIFLYMRTSIRKIFGFNIEQWMYIPPLIITVFGSVIVESELDNILRYFLPMPEFIQRAMLGFFENPVSAFLLLVPIASLSEELLFRAVILRGFLNHYSKWTAIIVSAVLFSLMHLNPYQFFSAFLLGVVLGWIYTETRSIYLCFFVHGLHNLIAWAGFFGYIMDIPGFSGEIDLSKVAFQPFWFDLLGIAALAAGLAILHRMFRKSKSGP